ncbi:MAG TPA: hypothetical protein VGI84_05130, partial [Pseudonocardiaceae bacterium]
MRATLADPSVTSGVLWITPDVAASTVITGIEIPALLARAEASDGFVLFPVAAGGLDYDAAARAALTASSINDFSSWSMIRVADDPATAEQITGIARGALVRRLRTAHTALPAEGPLVIDVFTRGGAPLTADAALTLDLTHRFDGRHAHPDAWPRHLLPALAAVIEEAERLAPGRPLQLRGFIGLPTAAALGSLLLAPRGLAASWLQRTPRRPDALYSLAAAPTPSGFRV